MSYSVPFIRPIFPEPELIASDYAAIVESNWFTNFGPREREFSLAIADYIGEGYHAVTFANATLALMGLVQGALGRGDGTRYVLVPSFTFAAGPASIEWAGYRPYFIDIDRDNLQPSLESARAALSTRGVDIAGVLLCNTFGIGHERIREWQEWAAEEQLPLLIDSAAGFGSRYASGEPVGTAGLAEVFSFHATKPFAIGEGGAVLTRDPDLAQRLRGFQNFGFGEGRGALELGLNAKLQEINAAIGLRQLRSIDAAVADRQSVVGAYRSGLAGLDIHFPHQLDVSSVCFASVLLPDRLTRDRALTSLHENGVEARAYYAPAVHRQPHFETAAGVGDLPVTEEIADRILSLPVHQAMPAESIGLVIAALRRTMEPA